MPHGSGCLLAAFKFPPPLLGARAPVHASLARWHLGPEEPFRSEGHPRGHPPVRLRSRPPRQTRVRRGTAHPPGACPLRPSHSPFALPFFESWGRQRTARLHRPAQRQGSARAAGSQRHAAPRRLRAAFNTPATRRHAGENAGARVISTDKSLDNILLLYGCGWAPPPVWHWASPAGGLRGLAKGLDKTAALPP